jgi:hypothetical protein
VYRAWRLCMYDPFVCVVGIAFPLSIVWSVLGESWRSDAVLCVRCLPPLSSLPSTCLVASLSALPLSPRS